MEGDSKQNSQENQIQLDIGKNFVMKTRKRNGITHYLIVAEGEDEKKGQWVKENEPFIYKQVIEQYEDDKKKNIRKQNSATPRRILKIAGVMEIDNEKWFIVRFTDSDVFEKVSHADMKNRYTKSLLAYYEQHIVLKSDNSDKEAANQEGSKIEHPDEKKK